MENHLEPKLHNGEQITEDEEFDQMSKRAYLRRRGTR